MFVLTDIASGINSSNIGFTYKLGRRVGKNRAWRIDHSISVVDLSIIKMYPAPDFEEAVARYHFTRRILEKYKDHFILGSNYEFILQNANKMVLKTNIDGIILPIKGLAVNSSIYFSIEDITLKILLS